MDSKGGKGGLGGGIHENDYKNYDTVILVVIAVGTLFLSTDQLANVDIFGHWKQIEIAEISTWINAPKGNIFGFFGQRVQ